MSTSQTVARLRLACLLPLLLVACSQVEVVELPAESVEWCEGLENGYIGISINERGIDVALYAAFPPTEEQFVCEVSGNQRVTVDSPVKHATRRIK